jgi:dipeptidyl aminopeptidase/acylaminoacyl peptidase
MRIFLLSFLIVAPTLAQPAPRVYRDRVEPHWFENDAKFWYRNELPGGKHEFVLVDVSAGTRSVVSDPATLPGAADAATLPADTRPRPSRRTGEQTEITFVNHTPTPVTIYWLDTGGERRKYSTLNPGESWESHTFDGHVWLVTDPANNTLGVYEATAAPATATIGDRAATRPTATTPRRGRTSARPRAQSPDGRYIAFVRDANLWLRPTAGGEEVRLSEDGKPSDPYDGGQIFWSPDSRHVVALRTEPAQEHKIYTVESSPKDQVQPKLRTLDYLKPGDRIAHPRPQLFDVESRKHVSISEELLANPWSIEDVRWAADSSRFTFVYNQRGHQALRVVAVDAASGAARALVDEKSETFICYSGKYFCHWIGDDEILWASERDGWNHLWLYEAKSGEVKNQVTKGDWVVQRVEHVDEEKRQIWFYAGGVRAEQDPYYTHFCRINFDGTGLTILTEGNGAHSIKWKAGLPAFLDTWSRVDQPPVTELRRSDNGALISKLETAEVINARRAPEPFSAKGRDGKTDIYGVILFPRDFDPAKKYPVLENIYAGPQGFFTPKAFRAEYGTMQRLADRGMIVVQADGMGTSGRSKAFHDVCWKNLRDAGFPDRIAWMKAAAAKHPQMDLSRVGIYGGSAGGQSAMGALLWHHDFYKVAVADCGCHDNRMDKIWWNEQWMGWPVDKSYEESSNVVNAGLLEGKLMLIVGEMDDNVDPASTMQVAAALEKATKDFELVVVAGAHHGAGETPYGSRRRAEFLTHQLVGSAGAE